MIRLRKILQLRLIDVFNKKLVSKCKKIISDFPINKIL